MINSIDIEENEILEYDYQVFSILLKDNSSKQNIIWATDNYASFGKEYTSKEQITIKSITGKNGTIIRPRAKRTKDEQISRVRNKAEVFTPSWMCNKQNNLVDSAWFGFHDVFNIESNNGWKTLDRPIPFPSKNGKTWEDYVKDVRLEITCGEAPYLVSRYDTISGKIIPLNERIGLLDRKLRVISENTKTEKEWYQWVIIAFQSIYGYEWQGDNLLLARENLLYTFIDYYQSKFNNKPSEEYICNIVKIISWNIWQMDGLKGVIPNSCMNSEITSYNLFGEIEKSTCSCEGCINGDITKHNGVYCKIKDWTTGKTLKFSSLVK